MDYEKKYKEALFRAKESMKDGGISSNTIAFLESIFPELKESEDEKIIYDAIKEVCNVEDARAFAKHNETVFNVAKRVLEKQGEQKPEWRDEDENMIRNLQSELSNLAARKLIKGSTYQKYSDWLKSLHPQKWWKPMEEQINSLSKVLQYYGDVNQNAHNVKKLLEQLEAL